MFHCRVRLPVLSFMLIRLNLSGILEVSLNPGEIPLAYTVFFSTDLA